MAFIDAAYVECMLGFELDGHRTHATRAERAADNRREHMLRDSGWDIRRFTYEQVMDDGPAVARAVKSARAQAAQRFGDNP
jgi:very-short-patch-repair endonuclease